MLIIPIFVAFHLFLFATSKIVSIQLTPIPITHQIKSSSVGTQAALTNDKNYAYYGIISVGTPEQNYSVLFDTGSYVLWLSSINCKNCKHISNYFDSSLSSTFKNVSKKYDIVYAQGAVKGDLVEDFVNFDGMRIYSQFLLVDQQIDSDGIEGLLGLSNNYMYDNIFDLSFKQGLLSSNIFGFKLGNTYLKEKSYFYYNISRDDIEGFEFVKLYDSIAWVFSADLSVSNKKFARFLTTVDTGSTFSHLPPNVFKQIWKSTWFMLCPQQNKHYVCNCDKSLYPDLVLIIEETKIILSPQMYIIGEEFSTKCSLAIIPNGMNLFVLGQNFMRHYDVIFDKEDNRIGFKKGNMNIFVKYIANQKLLKFLHVLLTFLVVLLASLICLPSPSQTLLSEPINRTIQMSLNMADEVQ